jgi:mRNA interferase HigB
MHIISIKMLREFWQRHPAAESALRQWHSIVEHTDFRDFNHVRGFFRSADYVPPFVVFDICGNNLRIVVVIQYQGKKVYVREVMTHREYDDWCKQYRKGKV